MRVAVDFQDERLELELPEERLVGSWHGPQGFAPEDLTAQILSALENPRIIRPCAR
jgi:hypothetical protein